MASPIDLLHNQQTPVLRGSLRSRTSELVTHMMELKVQLNLRD